MRDIIFIGDGLGVRTYCAKFYGMDVLGTDISEWAVNHSNCKGNMILDDISETKLIEMKEYAKLLVAYDILEHLTDKQLNKALINISKLADNFVFSIPFKGSNNQPDDPNLALDKTHKQFRTKEQWIKLIESHGIKIEETPKEWLFAHQILVGRKI